MNYTKEQLDFLKNLNSLLAQKEKELLTRCRKLVESYEKRLMQNSGDLDNYTIEVLVTYRTSPTESGNTHVQYIFACRDEEYYKKKDMYLIPITRKELKERCGFPNIGEEPCPLMHRLYFHSDIAKKLLFKIIDLYFDVHITEHQHVKIGEYKIFM